MNQFVRIPRRAAWNDPSRTPVPTTQIEKDTQQ